jgi:hypothetical protein
MKGENRLTNLIKMNCRFFQFHRLRLQKVTVIIMIRLLSAVIPFEKQLVGNHYGMMLQNIHTFF